jgi:translation initiation factor IF-2
MGHDITVGDLAKQLSVKSSEIIKKLMAQGMMVTINQEIDFDTVSIIAADYSFEVKSNVVSLEDILSSKKQLHSEAEKHERPPIVTIMGHVDHGKTSILDAIRKAKVVDGEAGGITQHIGAYKVDKDGRQIAFLDTPGHEAFSAMRARGAQVTDIVVLVVAADDGVMPQTIEAISHAKAAEVPIIVAVNKMDKPNINLERVYGELMEHGIQSEEWGGDTQFVKVSALQGTGLDDLLDAILLQSEILELTAAIKAPATGSVVEAHLDKGRGPVATVMVQEGELKVGDYIVAGNKFGRVRAMHDHRGIRLDVAGPSTPVEVLGLSDVPMAGDVVDVVNDEKTAREVADWRVENENRSAGAKSSAASLDELLNKVKAAETPELPVIIKADTQGSLEAIAEAVLKLNSDRVRNRIVHKAVGGVNESDLTLAETSNAVVVAFNVRAARGLDDLAEQKGVLVKYFSVIYDIVDALKAVMAGKLPPVQKEVVQGHAEVRQTIRVPKLGTVAGTAVLDGKVTRSSNVRLIRDEVVIFSGKVGSLRRFKDDVREVAQGYECGIGIEGYNDIREGDVIESFIIEEHAPQL